MLRDFFLKKTNEIFPPQPPKADPMDVLQAGISLLAMGDPELADDSREANVRKSIRLIARLPVLIAVWHRIRQGLEPAAADNSLSRAANFLWQLHGKKHLKRWPGYWIPA